ncbi:Phosphoribosylanthranilate isomerase [hydrothermal vent metagenome]|uniref:phosphoribosylanthranilate isomerase n=1 Tax=hydrothermal vent metagenome TaxID=652676 RepID=A0A3B1E5R3_9ZZZZ
MKIKICGITNLQDALNAIDAGAHALGFVFYSKSSRYITPQNAKKIIEQLPPFIINVGLFVEETTTNINYISAVTKINLVQIHFDVVDEFYKNLNLKYIKVVRAKTKDDVLKHKNNYILVDSFVDTFGGEGKRLNLEWFKDIDCSKIILAGGLNNINVSEINNFGFYGVDVSSGVEQEKGLKEKQKMITFCKKIHEIS